MELGNRGEGTFPRFALPTALDAYQLRYPEEREVTQRFLRLLASQVSCYMRSDFPGHITGSAWVVDATGTKTLLTHHRKLGRWLQLGGHSDGDTDTLAVAHREAVEESGIAGIVPVSSDIFDLDIHEIPARGAEPAHLHYDVRFCFRAPPDAQIVVSDESFELVWKEIAEIQSGSYEGSLRRMAGKWLVGAPFARVL